MFFAMRLTTHTFTNFASIDQHACAHPKRVLLLGLQQPRHTGRTGPEGSRYANSKKRTHTWQQQFYHFPISSLHHFIISTFHHFIISSFHHLIISSSHHFIISSFHHFIISSFRHFVISSFHPRVPTSHHPISLTSLCHHHHHHHHHRHHKK